MSLKDFAFGQTTLYLVDDNVTVGRNVTFRSFRTAWLTCTAETSKILTFPA